MRRISGVWLVTGMVLVLAGVAGPLRPGAARAERIIVLPRPGQVGVSVSGLYGTLLESGSVGDQFGAGAGLAVRVRYRMRYERAIGLSFESHGFDPRAADSLRDLFDGTMRGAGDPYSYKRLNVYLYGVDFYQMFGTRTKTAKLVEVGAGIAHPIFALNDGESQYPFGDGVYVGAGAGIERFFWQSMAFELGARYQAVFLDGKVNHDFQASVGLMVYASL